MQKFLRPTTGDRLPGAVIVYGLSVRGVPVSRHANGPGSDTSRSQRADRIFANYWRYENGCRERLTDLCTTNTNTWWTWLYSRCRNKSCTWVIGLNVYAGMTALGLWDELKSGNLRLAGSDRDAVGGKKESKRKPWEGYAILSDPPTVIVLRPRCGSGTIKIVDVRNYGIRDYKDLTERVTHNLSSVDWDYNESAGNGYAAREITAIEAWAIEWFAMLKQYGLGSAQHTIAAQAYYSFRRTCLKPDTVLYHDDNDLLSFERSALHGGRCEARYIGKVRQTAYHLDIRSAYHYAALSCDIPTSAIDSIDIKSASQLMDVVNQFFCVADVSVNTVRPAYPYRAVCDKCKLWRQSIGQQYATRPCKHCITVWPTGQFRTQLCGEELWGASASGNITSVHRLWCYHSSTWLLDWPRKIESMREDAAREKNVLMIDCIKRLGVSLYGKFSQRGFRWAHQRGEIPDVDWSAWYQINEDTGEPELWRSFAGRVERQVTEQHGKRCMPIVTAAIYAAARIRLWEILSCASVGTVWYYDTDSVWCDWNAYAALQDAGLVRQNEMGYLRYIEHADDLEIMGIKHYRANRRLVKAGVPAYSNETPGPPRGAEQIEPVTSACIASRPPSIVRPAKSYTYKELYRHGVVRADGTVFPHHLG